MMLVLFLAFLAASPPENPAQNAPVRITFAAVGDVNFGTSRSALQKENAPFAFVDRLLKGRDIVYGNLETPVALKPLRNVRPPMDCRRETCTKTQEEYAYWYKITFWTAPASLRTLKNAGFTFLGTANNHVLDQGEAGLLETISHLKAAGLAWAGTGATEEEAWTPYVYEKQGVKVALFAVTSLLNLGKPRVGSGAAVAFVPAEKVLNVLPAKVREAKKNNDFVVVALHYGVEMQWRTADWEIKWFQALAEAGCDLFIGAHPHVLRGISVHGSMPAFHSLGNFLFSINADLRIESGVVHAEFVKEGKNRRLENVLFYPVRADGGKLGLLPRALAGRDARKIINNVLYYSKRLRNPPGTLSIEGDTLRVQIPARP